MRSRWPSCARRTRYAADYERRLAAEIVAMLPGPEEARQVLAFVDAILNLKPPPQDPGDER